MTALEPLGDFGSPVGMDEAVRSIAVGSVAPDPVPVAAGYLVVRKASEAPPVRAPFAEVKDRVVADFQASQRRAVAEERAKQLRERAVAGADLDTLFLRYGGLRSSKAFGRSGPIPDFSRDPALARDSVYLERIFTAAPGTVLPAISSPSGTLFAKVETLTSPSPSEFASRREDLRRELLEQRIAAWTERLRSRATITIHRSDLKGLAR
jgi:hypothetical protein